jgi:glycosyltransferase involved in cell wall biosynthesis
MHIALMAVSAATAPAGVCRYAANLALGLQSVKGVDQVTLLTGAWQTGYFEKSLGLSGDRLRIVPIDIPNTSLSRNAWYLLRLPRLVQTLHTEILHLTFPAPFLGSSMRIPVVVSLHDLYPLDLPRNFGSRAWLNRLALSVALQNADAIVCGSNHTRQRLSEAYSKLRCQIFTIPHPIAHFGPSNGDSLPSELEGRPFVLCVAQHRANKNLLTLVRGFSEGLKANILSMDSVLAIVGNEGPETKPLQAEISSLGLTNRVLLLHGLPDVMLASMYRRCDLFIAPSIMEGFGLPVAEAIAHGKRVLCTDIPAFRELATGACTFYPADANAMQLAAWIATALTAPRSAHDNRFLTPLQAANRYLAVYQGLLQPKDLRSASATTSEPLSTGDA